MSVLEKSLVRIFRVCCLLFSYQCSFLLLPFHATAFILYQSVSCLSTTFLFLFLLLWSNPSRDSLFRIAYSSRLVNSFLISFCNLLFSKFSSEYSHTHARIFMQNFLFFIRSASACHSLVSVSTSKHMVSYHGFLELSMLFLYFAQFRIFWHFLRLSSVLRLSKLFPYSPESESLKTFNFYNFVIAMIPGSKGQKADASLLARGFLTSWPAKNMSK